MKVGVLRVNDEGAAAETEGVNSDGGRGRAREEGVDVNVREGGAATTTDG